MCRWNLLQKDSKGLQQKHSKFCSIECKARFLSWELDHEERYEVVDQESSCSSKATKMNDIQAYLEDESVNNMQASTELEDQSVEKRRRKGIPKRSPLF
ncbi:Zinc-binding family protein [Quillaja saponaria]|uniref:Zinc-binding family protein n=1 Tax=Quillaja saponaria TaxID=32244 RepID=A0AAD7L916_QUISA|nr:Zinc-binding family protein [Quillaja saponaria]